MALQPPIKQMTTELYPVAVYTIRHSKVLSDWAKGGKPIDFRENKRWVSVAAHLKKANAIGARIPILFAAGETTDGVIYVGLLDSLIVSEPAAAKGEYTEVTVSSLRRLDSKRPLKELRLVSTGKALSERFIRPYAICHTPSFV